MKTSQFLKCRISPTIPAILLGIGLFALNVPCRAQADTTFAVSATFSDNSSTPLVGILIINTATGAIDGFNFSIPTMTIGSTTLPGAQFTPSTANAFYFTHAGGSEVDIQLFGAPSNSEELYLEIPQTTLVSYAGGLLLQEVTSGETMLHSGYQSGAQSNPFIELTSNGSITLAHTVTYSDFGPNMTFNTSGPSAGWCVSGPSTPNCGPEVTRWIAAPFTPAGDFNLTQVQLALNFNSGTTNRAVVNLVNDADGFPGTTVLESWTVTDLPSVLSPAAITLNSTGGIILHGDTQYWLVAETLASDSNTLVFWWTNNQNLSGGVTSLDSGASWTALGPGDTLPAFAVVGTVNPVLFNPSTTPETQIATIGNPSDPAAQSLALTLASVTNAINVWITFFYEPTDVSTDSHGIGIADGVCEAGATEDTDFDCRLAADFTYPAPLLPTGDRLVPHIIPSHNNMGVWGRVFATRVSDGMPAVAGTDYAGPVEWYYAWNANPSLANPTPNPDYIPGWNNQNEQMYDRPGENVDIAFVANITTFSKSCSSTTCVGTADPGKGGKTKTLNDIVVAAPPNPSGTADKVEPLVPVPGISPFPYLKRLPMLVSFELENGSTDKPDPTALTLPHSVSVATLDPSGNPIPVQYPAGFPTTFTYNPFLKEYYIYLSPTPYKTDGTVYTMQIDSDLFPQPVNLKFVVKGF